MHSAISKLKLNFSFVGLPKGVQLTHANLMVLNQTSSMMREILKMTYDEPMKSIAIGPWSHSMGFMSAFLGACSIESSLTILDQFEPKLFLSCIEVRLLKFPHSFEFNHIFTQKYRINAITVSPPILVFFTKSPLFDDYDLSSLREIFCGSALITKELDEAVKARFKDRVSIRQVYGMTETTTGVTTSFMGGPAGCVGSIVKGMKGKVIDENGKSLGPNQTGELCFKGPRIMKGYLENEAATKETIDENGWLHTGDIGYYDEDFIFFIVDRKKELIKYNAFQVPPAEIELLLQNHPKLKDAGVIGIPDERTGEKAFAFVVPRPATTVSKEEIFDYVRKNLSKPKHLHGGIKFIDEIPRNPSGKVLRRELKLMHEKSKIKSKL